MVEDKVKGFDEVFVFRRIEGFRVVAVFKTKQIAEDNLPKAQTINGTIKDIKEFKDWCKNPKWNQDGKYFDCRS